MQRKKKVKCHIKWKSVFIFLMLLLFLGSVFFYLSNLHIKNIYIVGNKNLRDHEIILSANIKDYPKMFKYSIGALKRNISRLELVEDVTIHKSFFGKLTIEIKEADVLFYNRTNGSYVLSNGKEVADGNYVGIPFLINIVPDTIYERLIKEFASIKLDSLKLISEIEYSPSKSGEIVIDDTRFLLRMNDGNQVHINLINMSRLDKYAYTYAAIPSSKKGIWELDSDSESIYWHLVEEES